MPNIARHLTLITAILLLSSAPTHAAPAFRVCADPSNLPFSNQQGDGFENKIAALFGKALHRPVEYTWFPQRIGFIRNTLKAKQPDNDNAYLCDVVMGYPVGFDQVATTRPYYRSTYAFVYAKQAAGMAGIKTVADIDALDEATRRQWKIAMFDQSAGTPWLIKHGLAENAIPYPSLSGDADKNTAEIIKDDMAAGKVDVAVLWGPIAAYVVSHTPKGRFAMLPLQSEADIRFDFAMSMGVRHGDDERKNQLDQLIGKHAKQITAIMKKYGVPLLDKDGHLLKQ
ncbi:MAG: quinoprotein dehydrogenase-associated putative ABC transporter substrate-binding protein [Methylococcaceae bacterium]|nr:MAG: quinoprotein dehydrogenase-associated putative ABC transporter substrate-binding protein [Methylococcaceae bacterium]